jgi:uncharacterized protein
MPGPVTEQERQAFLAEPHIAVISVASDDNRPPLTVPIWYAYEPGDNVTYFTASLGRTARKMRLIQNAAS